MNKKAIKKNKTFIIGSLYQWALASCVIITLPLVFAIFYTITEVKNYTQKSQLTLIQTINATDNSRIILDRLISMERSIRQFQVLIEPELFISYQGHREKFIDLMASLQSKDLNPKFIEKLQTLSQNENSLHEQILQQSKTQQLTETDLSAFDALTTETRALLAEGEKRASKEAKKLSKIASRVRQRLLYSALVSIPIALLLGLAFVHLLTRPIKAIGQAIHNLGEDGFEKPISIKGPQDLTDLAQHLEWLRKKLNQVEYEKQQFIRNVSHELKTPLATLKEGTDLLAENVVGELNTEQQEIIQLMKLSNINIYGLVENLLEYQSILSTQVDLNLTVFNIAHLIERIVNEYELLLRRKNITLNNQVANIKIKADYEKLKIIIGNIFSNALKFSPKNGTMGLTLSTHDSYIQLLIEDQGKGIDKEIQPLIFKDFYKGYSNHSWKIRSSGLGLALVKYYLDAHKGSIQLLEPNKQYCGARFSLQFPLNINTHIKDGSTH